MILNKQQQKALQKVLEYLSYEEEDYLSYNTVSGRAKPANHIWISIERLNKLFENENE